MKCPFEPLFARVVVHRELATKIGNIMIPDEAAKRRASLRCRVVAVGPSADKSIGIGDEVLIGRYSGDWINEHGDLVTKNEDAGFFIVQDEDIIARIKT